MTSTTRHLLALGVSLGTVLFLLLGIGALGIVGDGDRDWLYLAAPVVGLLVAVATRFRVGGMALALAATAGTTVVAGATAVVLVATDRATGSIVDVVMLTGMYAALFALAAWLFRPTPA
jgi:energy-converting hydrogenase Eha subunit H